DKGCAERADRPIRRQVLLVDRLGLGLEILRALHAIERPEEIHRGRPALAQHRVGLGRAFAEHDAEGGGAADRRRAAHHHVTDCLRDLLGRAAGDVDLLVGEEALVQKLEAVAAPADRFDRLGFLQTTRSLPPSTGTCAAVVLANSGPHISAASSATSLEDTSCFSRLFFLYCSTVRW